MAQLGFNVEDVPPSSGDFTPIPDGTEVELHAIEEALAANSKSTGELLTLKFEVLSGEYAGRTIMERINVSHQNPVAQKIGQEQISALCHAIGKMVSDTEELLWQPFRAVVTVEEYTKKDGTVGYSNKVKKYLFEGDTAPPENKPAPTRAATTPASRAAPAGRPAAATTGAKVPWGSKAR